MNTIEQSAELLKNGKTVAQGDVMLRSVDSLPAGLKEGKAENGLLIVAHSETGHHHALAVQPNVTVWDKDEFFSYVENRTGNVIELKHFRSFDTHAPIGIPPGVTRITRQREYTAEGYRRAMD